MSKAVLSVLVAGVLNVQIFIAQIKTTHKKY